MPKKIMFILASHEPTLDPRLDWVGHSAAQRYDTTIFGFQLASRPAPPCEMFHGYAVVRLAPRGAAAFSLSWWLAGKFFTPRSRGLLIPVELLIKIVTAISVLLILALLSVGYAIFAVLSLFKPIRWTAVGFHAARRAFARTVSPDRYEKTRDRWRSLAAGLRTQVARPIKRGCARWLPWSIPFGKAVSHWLHRIQQFSRMVKHFVTINGTLLCLGEKSPAPDLIYCNDLETLIAGVLLSDHFRCRLIYDAHEYMACSFPDYLWFEAYLWSALERTLVAHVDAAFTVNPLLAAAMTEATGVSFRSLPNCEPARTGVLGAQDTPELVDQAKGRVRFLYQGNFEHHRGIEEVIRAWAKVDHTRAVLFLRGPNSELREYCIQLAADLKALNDSVFFVDPVRETDLVAAASQADVGIIPYKPICINNRLACPNKTSQYMQAGLAVLTNKLDFVKQLVADFECGLAYDSNHPDSFVAAVHRFADDHAFLLACQQNARIKVAEVFNWEVQSRDLFDTCDMLMNADHCRADDVHLLTGGKEKAA